MEGQEKDGLMLQDRRSALANMFNTIITTAIAIIII
jgi:hypothetical protein